MPDEALQLSLQGRPRQAPDFSPLALAHLHTSCLAVRQLIKRYLSESSQLEALIIAVEDIHNTLQLLDRQGAKLVTAELILLLKAMDANTVDDVDACAHTLVFAGDRLADYVSHLQKPGAIDSALPLLPVINNCRACRSEELLSEMLVVASGIDLPDTSKQAVPDARQINLFVEQVKASRQPLMNGLLGWFTNKEELHQSLSELSVVFARLAKSCDAPTALKSLMPLFESAEFICQSVSQGALDNSAALQKLFAQIERMLDGFTKLPITDEAQSRAAFARPVPERLYLNLLYYVALSTASSPKAMLLRRRFRLDRFIPKTLASDPSQVSFDGVGDRLADSIRDAIEHETEAARTWLSDSKAREDENKIVRHRLAQLEPAIMLLGAQESLRHMTMINESFVELDNSEPQSVARVKEQLADSLVRLERALDTELNAVRVRANPSNHTDLESILAACLAEAELKLLAVEEDLVVVFRQDNTQANNQPPSNTPASDSSASVDDIIQKLSTINSALQVLPLPEVSPLIKGVQNFIKQHEHKSLSQSTRGDLATVMVSLGYYLNSVLQPNGAAGQLLLEAEEAMLNLSSDELVTSDNKLSDAEQTLNTEAEGFITTALSQLSIISACMPDYQRAELANDLVQVALLKTQLITAYDLLSSEALAFKATELAQLANANIRVLDSNVQTLHAHALLEESVAVLPQLINQMQSGSDQVDGLQHLVRRLDDASAQDKSVAFDESAKIDSTQNESTQTELYDEDSEDLTLAMDVHGILKHGTTDDEVDALLETASTEFEVTAIDAGNFGGTETGVTEFESTGFEATEFEVTEFEVTGFETSRLEDTRFDATEIDTTAFESTAFEATQHEQHDKTVLLDSSLAHDATIAMDATGAMDVTAADLSDEGPVMTLDNTLEQVFFRECDQHMLNLQKAVADALSSKTFANDAQRAALLRDVQKAGVNMPDINPLLALPDSDMLRALHTLTGSAQTVDAQAIIAIAQPLQKAALYKQRSGESFNRVETEYIGELLEILNERLEAMEAQRPIEDDDASVMIRLNDFVSRCEPWVPERKAGLALGSQVGAIESVFEEEARELLETLREEELRLSVDDQRTDALKHIFSCLHTIKGSARMAGQVELADRAHALEDELRLADGVALDAAVQNGLGELQTIMLVGRSAVQRQQLDTALPTTDTASVSDEAVNQTQVVVPGAQSMGFTESSFDNMLSLATRATTSQAKLGESMLHLREACRDIENTSARLQRLPHSNHDEQTELNASAIREMLSDLESARRMLADALLDAEAENNSAARATSALHQTLIRAQLVRFDEAQIRLQHTLNDAASETDKNVALVIDGAELTIDKSMFRKIITPLEHLVRNAVVHGIESPAERVAAGKSEQGQVVVDAKIDGTDLLISIHDDGAGIDVNANEKIKDKLGNAATINKQEQANRDDDVLLELLCESGFTTNTDVDQLAGRGLGLASVKQACDDLDGSLQLITQPGVSTTFTVRLPQKIRINQVVLVEHKAMRYAIPVNFVHTVSDEQLDMSSADIQYDNEDYSCCALDAVLNREMSNESGNAARQAVLIGVHEQHIALLVDKVLGYREIIAQPLGAQLSGLKRYIGGAVLANGNPVLIPDFNRLLNSENSLPLPHWSAANESVVSKTALIVDDSITMRIAAEQMLHDFGIQPSMARDGAEALELVADALPDVLLVDIDMPRINGFDFLRHLRVTHPEHNVPVVMISTRDTKADRDEARELGASAYLVKPYKEQQLQDCLVSLGVMS